MNEWLEIASKSTMSAVALIACGAVVWFFYRHLWPLIKGQLERAEAAQKVESERRSEELQKFLDALRHLDSTADERARAHVAAMNQVAQALHSLREEVLHSSLRREEWRR